MHEYSGNLGFHSPFTSCMKLWMKSSKLFKKTIGILQKKDVLKTITVR